MQLPEWLSMSTFNDRLPEEIAAVAARWVVEEGLDYGGAKRRAVKQMGLPTRTALPSNELMDEAVREYIDTFCADTQPLELAALRRQALVWMLRLQAFRPHLSGAVWQGTATKMSDIYIQLFCDDSKAAEIELIDHRVQYVARTVNGLHGEPVDALSLHVFCEELQLDIGVHLLIYSLDDLRGALQPDRQGRKPRGDITAVRRLMQDDEDEQH